MADLANLADLDKIVVAYCWRGFGYTSLCLFNKMARWCDMIA